MENKRIYIKTKFDKIDNPKGYIGKYVHVSGLPNKNAYKLISTDGYTHTLAFRSKNPEIRKKTFLVRGKKLKKTNKMMREENAL